jgi:hypothetical protein
MSWLGIDNAGFVKVGVMTKNGWIVFHYSGAAVLLLLQTPLRIHDAPRLATGTFVARLDIISHDRDCFSDLLLMLPRWWRAVRSVG